MTAYRLIALMIENVCETEAAARKFALPACAAVIVHEPAPVRVTRVPATVQLPEAEKLTVKPDVAVALTLKSASPKVLPGKAAKVIVWLAWATVKLCGTLVAAR